MPKKIVNEVHSMLTEEKWTRATLHDYAITSFHELDSLIENVIAKGLQDEILKLCDEHLEHTKNSIVALYISGVISLSKQQVDDSHLLNLIGIFSDNHKWTAVEYLCRRILDFGENKDALRSLAETLEHLARQEDKFDVWERLIRVDYSETDIVRNLAVKREEEGNIEEAILYYRKAIHRFVNKNLFGQVRDIWDRLVKLGVDDYEFFFLIEKKVAKTMSIERAITLLEELYPAIKEREEWGTAIEILKRILNYDGKNNWARGEIILCYKAQYSAHSQLDEYIRLSNLNQNWRNVLVAIADFEKHISFDSGSFVFHKTWGVGIIKEIKGDELIIDFTKKRAHPMSLKMAVEALQSLPNDHIWTLKSVHSKEKLRSKIRKDIPWALKTIIRSFDNVADMKKIKSELVPTILTASEWSTWSSEAREILKTDSVFGNVPDKLDQFVVRDKPMSYEEKTFNQFKAEKSFFGKIQAVRDFLDHSDPASEFFAEMFDYFMAFLKSGNVSVYVVGSYLFVTDLCSTYPFLTSSLEWGFSSLWEDIDDPVAIFTQLEDSELRRSFLSSVRKEVERWDQVYLTLFPIQLSRVMLDELLSAGYKESVLAKLEEIVEHYREYRDALVWIARNIVDGPWLVDLGMKLEKILINMIRLMSLSYNDIENRREVSYNRRLNRQIQSFLFKEGHLEKFLVHGDKDSAIRVFTLLEDIEKLDPVLMRNLKTVMESTFPGIKFYGDRKTTEPVTASSSRYFFTTQESLEAKQRELRNIVDVEIPRNSREIGAAIELGDLSENAEYKVGKERQESLQIQVGRLKDELDRARRFPEDIREPGKAGFGTIITIDDLVDEKTEAYTILGPWESDPSQKIISYLSPFGSVFVGKSIGATLKFEINDRAYHFRIKDVQAVPLS